jgi:hypothetical protein
MASVRLVHRNKPTVGIHASMVVGRHPSGSGPTTSRGRFTPLICTRPGASPKLSPTRRMVPEAVSSGLGNRGGNAVRSPGSRTLAMTG